MGKRIISTLMAFILLTSMIPSTLVSANEIETEAATSIGETIPPDCDNFATVDKDTESNTESSAGYLVVDPVDTQQTDIDYLSNGAPLTATSSVLSEETEKPIASGTCGENATWTLTAGILAISGTGDMTDYSDVRDVPWYGVCSDITQIEIGEGITSVGKHAFNGCTNLVNVSIPDSVISVGVCAFVDCSSLVSIVLSDHLTSIGDSAFYGCSSLQSITIPNGVTCIERCSFYGCSSLVGIELSDHLISIGEAAFYGCSSLQSITIPDNVSSIGINAFSGCSSLASVELPRKLTTINKNMFMNCTSLCEITIPDAVSSIGSYAFWGCTQLARVDMPYSVAAIGQQAFRECSSLTSIVIPGGVRSIGVDVFYGCSNLTGVTIEYGLTYIPEYVFANLSNLCTVTIPGSVAQIEAYAFQNCTGLTSIVIPESVTDIEEGAFRGCSGLTSIAIPESVTSIGTGAFMSCTKMRKITFYGNAPDIGEYAFTKVSTSAYYPANNETWTEAVLQYYGGNISWQSYTPCTHNYAIDSVCAPTCTKVGYTTYICSLCEKVYTEYTDAIPHNYVNDVCDICGIPYVLNSGSCGDSASWTYFSDGLLRISGQGEMAHYFHGVNDHDSRPPWYDYRGSIRTVVIEDEITSIGRSAFFDCTSLCNAVIPNSVTSIGFAAFSNCISLTDIILPEGIRSIEYNTFYACKNLISINIPEGVTSIGQSAFGECKKLASITIPASVDSIDCYAFEFCSSLTNVELPDNVQFLESGTFKGCSGLQSVELPKNLIDIGDSVFEGCNTLLTIDIPDGVARIGDQAFKSCKNLKAVSIPNSVQVIGQEAFWFCEQLTNVVIPYGVQSIWEVTFGDCSNLQSVTIPVTVRTIESCAFQQCAALTDVYYTGSEEQWNSISKHPGVEVEFENATVHYLETEQYDDTLIENEIQLTEGGQADWIDRFILPAYGEDFYNWLEESTDGDGQADVLIYDTSEFSSGAYTYKKQIAISAENVADLVVKLDREEHALITTVDVVYNLFKMEHPDVSWLSSTWSVGYSKERTTDTDGFVEIGVNVYFSQIDKDEYYASVALRDRMIAEIISAIPEDASDFEKIRYFNAYLTRNNCYNSDYPDEADSAHRAVTALEGNTGSDGPVCEAYARAFKLLCESQNIPCAYLAGTANNGESHGWNLVQMEDGNWYAVDITWNDPTVPDVSAPVSGYESEDYLLVGEETVINGTSFGASHVSDESTSDESPKVPNTLFPLPEGPTLSAEQYTPKEYTEHIAVLDQERAVKPTCTETGLTAGTYCYICNETLSAPEIIPTIAHSYESIITEPTCTEQGYTTHTCATCGDSYVDTYTEALGHSYGAWTTIVAETCTTDGEDRRDCENCDHYETQPIAAVGHSYESVVTAPTCTEQGYTTHTCSACGDSYVDTYTNALGHSYGAWSTTAAATCTADGEERRDCANCDYYEAQPIAAVGHSYESVVTAPTCTEQGYTTHTCTSCDDSYVDTYTEAKGHSWNEGVVTIEPTEETEGEMTYTCTVCGETKVETLPTLDHVHSYEAVVTAATCTAQGYTTHTCRCGNSYADSFTDPLGHDMSEWTVTDEPTCTETGEERRNCSRCDYHETQELAAIGHSYESVVTVPTCNEQGYTTHTCSACGDSYVDTYTDALGHSYGAWTTTVAATCTIAGEERRDCGNCDHYETQPIAALGHSYESVVTAPTCTEQGYTTHTCSACSDSYVDAYVPAAGHSYGEWTETKAPTCTEAGEETRTCACGETETREVEALGHSYEAVVTAPTCTEQGSTAYTCTVCGDSYVDSYVEATGHRYASVVTAPTCTEQGYTTHTCSACGSSYKDAFVAAIGHSFGEWAITTAPSCETEGAERRDCANCDHFETRTVEATGHSWNEGVVTIEPTEDTEGEMTYTCTVCGETRTETLPALDHVHDYEATVTAATCTAQGYTTHTCRCGSSYVDSYTDALGHDMSDWTVTDAPTCTDAGEERTSCSRCDYYETRSVAASGHDYHAEVTEPTCTGQGYTTYTCTVCGDMYTSDYTAAAHRYADGVCTVCGGEQIVSGECGTDVTWMLNVAQGELTVSGAVVRTAVSGEMADYESAEETPWYEYQDRIVRIIVENGVTRIGDYAFQGCANLTEVIMAEDVAEIGSCTFADCEKLESIIFAGDAPTIEDDTFTSAEVTVYYPAGNETWTDEVMESYGDAVIWIPSCEEHTVIIDAAVAPTCTETGLTEGSHCSVCGVVLVAQETVPATGHNFVPAAGTDPTCTEDGYVEYACSNCWNSDVAYRETVPATGHSYVDGVCENCGVKLEPVIAAPELKSSNVASSGKIKLTWNAVEGASKYQVYRSTSESGTYTKLKTTEGTNFTNTGAKAGTTYYYYVVAVAENGTKSAASEIVTRTCDCARPSVTISNVDSSGKIKLSWNEVDGAVSYKVYRSTTGKDGSWKLMKTTTSTSYTNTSAKAGTKYYYKVRAIAEKSAANSAYSVVVSRTCDLARPVVTLTNVASSGKIKVTWEAVDGAVSYKVYRSTSKSGTYSLVKTTTGTSYTNTSVTAGKTYYYKVVAVAEKSVANSAYSTVKSRTCDLARPVVSIALKSGKPRLTWSAIDGAVSYKIYRSTSKNGTYSLLKTTTSTSYRDTSAKYGKTYYYKVVAVHTKSAAYSAYSLVDSIKSK